MQPKNSIDMYRNTLILTKVLFSVPMISEYKVSTNEIKRFILAKFDNNSIILEIHFLELKNWDTQSRQQNSIFFKAINKATVYNSSRNTIKAVVREKLINFNALL